MVDVNKTKVGNIVSLGVRAKRLELENEKYPREKWELHLE